MSPPAGRRAAATCCWQDNEQGQAQAPLGGTCLPSPYAGSAAPGGAHRAGTAPQSLLSHEI